MDEAKKTACYPETARKLYRLKLGLDKTLRC